MKSCLLSPPIIRFIFFVERWIFSVLFLFVAYEYLDILRLLRLFAASGNLPHTLVTRDAGLADGVHFSDCARYILLAATNGTSGLLLLISRKPSRYPNSASEVVVPLLATFSYLLFNHQQALPAWMTMPFVPVEWSTSVAAVGVAFSVFGVLFSFYSMLWLGRSLGIVVSVREIILTGPYHYVRHPIYLGYGFLFFGMFLTACNVRMTVLIIGVFSLLCWRARLEERLLVAHSASYREWSARTGFLLPRREVVARVLQHTRKSLARFRIELARLRQRTQHWATGSIAVFAVSFVFACWPAAEEEQGPIAFQSVLKAEPMGPLLPARYQPRTQRILADAEPPDAD